MARVLIVDDSESIRELVRFLLETDPSLEVVGEAANGLEGMDRAEMLGPDLIVMDLKMPIMDGIECTRRIKEASPDVEIVAFTSATERSLVDAALAAGAYTMVDKDDVDQLIDVLHELATQPVATSTEAAPALVPSPPAPYWEGLRVAAAVTHDSTESMTQRMARGWAFGALAFGGAAIALLLFVLVLKPGGLEDPRVPRAGTIADGDIPRVGLSDPDAKDPEPKKDKARRKEGRARGEHSSSSGSTGMTQIAQAPAPSSSDGSSPSTSRVSKSSGASSQPQVAAIPAKKEVPAVAAANYRARPGADKGKGKEKRS